MDTLCEREAEAQLFVPQQVKTCTKCGAEKITSEFYRAHNGKFCVRGECSECSKDRTRKFNEDNPDYYANYYERNRDRELSRQEKYRLENPEKTRAAQKAWRKKNPDASNRRYAENKEHIKAQRAKTRLDNLERYRKYARDHMREKRLTPKGKLDGSIRAGVARGLIKGGKSGKKTFDILGYSVTQLMAHLEAKFSPEMNWENYGNYWHIDHIIPLSAHNYQTVDDLDFSRAWALSNLRPLEAKENLSKGAKLLAPFQPSLQMSV